MLTQPDPEYAKVSKDPRGTSDTNDQKVPEDHEYPDLIKNLENHYKSEHSD